jgi:SAM-dependent MidA family methyltransferase
MRLKTLISGTGLITYDTFLDTVLYDRDFGYYRSGKRERADFATSPEMHSVFGKIIGKYIEHLCDLLNTSSISVVELGGASGKLAFDVISAFSTVSLEKYYIVENGEERRSGQIEWVNSLVGFSPFTNFTVVLANEFFDALPFHKIICRDGHLEEIYVGYEEGFYEQTGPLSGEAAVFIDRFPVFLQEGQVLETTASLTPHIAQISDLVQGAGCLLVFDYGYHESDIRSGRFFEGSAVGYSEWKMRRDLFSGLGNMDVTHHVNFDHLTALLAENGWTREGEVPQYRFLYYNGVLEVLAGLCEEERLSAKWLINPEGMGTIFTTLGFSKNLPLPLPGFKRPL